MKTKTGENPMHRLPDWRTTMPLAHAAARCGARTRAGEACQAPAMPNGRCRMHGGASTGPRTAEGLARVVKGRTRAVCGQDAGTAALVREEMREGATAD